jgi:hypothetical protein
MTPSQAHSAVAATAARENGSFAVEERTMLQCKQAGNNCPRHVFLCRWPIDLQAAGIDIRTFPDWRFLMEAPFFFYAIG